MDTAAAALPGLHAERELSAGFTAFQHAAARLTASYEELRQRVAAMDLELAESNRRLRETLEERETILARLPVGVVALDAAGQIRSTNAEARRILGGVTVPAHGFPDGDGELRVPGELPIVARTRSAALPGGGRIVMLEDRSRMAALEHEVLRLDRLAALSELAFGIAHEIRNPLTAVAGFASLLRRSRDLTRVAEWSTHIEDGVRQVDEIVRNLLSFARPGQEEELRPTTPRELAQRAAAALSLPEGRVALAGDALELRLLTDLVGVRQILVNLLRNALEAGGSSVPLRLEAWAPRDPGGKLRLEVVDGGPGIAPELVAVIFDPFVTTKATGTGLGLALCQRVAGCLGGAVRLAGSRAGDTRFVLELPLRQAGA